MTSLAISLLLLGLSSAMGKVCLPSQMQARLNLWGAVSTNGVGMLQTGEIALYVNQNLKKAAYDINIMTGTTSSVLKAIEDHSVTPAVRYEFTDQTCDKKPPQFQFEPYCLPGDSQVIGNKVIGDPLGNQNATIYTYTSGTLSGRIAMSPRNIPLVQEQTMMFGNTSIMQTLVYYDAQLSVSDPSVFVIPAQCQQQKSTFGVIFGRK